MRNRIGGQDHEYMQDRYAASRQIRLDRRSYPARKPVNN